jgi:cellulose synthase/poly-beta-1,6-N-acetylglucosamine synthase-like glycosyltransferase
MLELIVISLLLLLLFFYLIFLWSIWRGLSSLPNPTSDATPFLSVIIPARNEERNIEGCLHQLVQQSYDRNNFEIIVVDDHSQDKTSQIAARLAGSIANPKITVVSLQDGSGKPAAIAYGISQSRGEIILCTDADCAVATMWVESMVNCFEPGVAFVAGPVFEQASSSLLSRLQAIEYLSLTTTAAGLIGSGKPIICSGASIGFRKSAFTLMNGFGDHASSCDDETLMQRMVLRNIGTVIFNRDASAIVSTEPLSEFSEFWRQRIRWASKKGRYEDSAIFRRLLLLYCFFLALFVTGICALVVPILRLPVVVIVLLKVLADWLVLSRGARLFRQPLSLGQFLIAELFHVPYIAVAGLIGQFSSLRWKDRNLDR